ncbi:BMP family ABC transporter substrate-binding protein [Vagococcus penaei]|uniref:BMP family ABC transporter substrate-binding protein n=1 Tax=Vagococcus penaei TaxID=633807 RepID=A0A1Q2D470_9ENTE|nr:BMP family ABC transporter substrate-binding protein [Vagococcus penaei]AQP53190.1 BMP family ABC transporter substrate-binding protein [Vagococcus penaei]RSU00992.1 BMP family ABC transporter substrate-binding protein [Vagococcus penaei]
MKSLSKVITSISLMGSAMLLTACGAKEAKQVEANETKVKSIVMVTDANGVDDKSFNQSAWEGLVDWGKETGAKKGTTGYDYIQSNDASEFTTNIDQALTAEFNTIAGVGFLIRDAIETVATQHPRQQFAIIDSVIEGKNNVVSATFRDGEVAYLAGIAAAYTTTTNHVGFIGGEEGAIIDRFEVGFKKGVQDAAEALNKSVKVDVKYAASFADPAKGKMLAARIYQDGADIIYHASGGTGAGVFQEAKALNESSADKKVWIIGADKDQTEDGNYKNKSGKADNLTLTSAVKRVGSALKDIANKANDGEFPGGEHLEYGLSNDGLELIDGNMDDKTIQAVKQAKDKIIAGDLIVPSKK